MLKVVLDESSLSLNATVMKLKKELTVLPELMASLNYDIPRFNDAVLSIEQQLTQYGSSAPELFHQVLPAYLSVPEEKFKTYVENKKSGHEDGTFTLTIQSLMDLARARYCTQQDQDDWNLAASVRSSGNPDFVALQARAEKTKKELDKVKKQLATFTDKPGKGKNKKAKSSAKRA